eukprot:TRINITY_DN4399_c0_g1_i2.p1 TRINITY_DN4399_c0_g1~~TRINITY_DN4399_c0_g1_i2.p1  ORF type:complete len:193 (-),score=36.16 TRINITY_DN4399_c0_g1_i2:53-631(-)
MAKAALPTRQVTTMTGHAGAVNVAVFNSSGTYCLTGGADRAILLWNPYTGKHIKAYRGHNHEVLDIAVSKDNSRIASGGGDKYPLHWDVGTGQIIRRYRGHENRINSLKFNDEDTLLVTGSYDTTTKIWDCKSRSIDPIQTLGEAKDSVTSVVVLSPYIFTGSVDGGVRCYDVRMGSLVADQMGSTPRPACV